MFEVILICCYDELVADVGVDPDVAHAQRQHTQAVLVVVGQRTTTDCEKDKKE